MPHAFSLLAVIALTLASGCHRDDAAAYADVDCSRMTDHMIDVLVRDGSQTQAPIEAEIARDKMFAQRDTLVAGCLKDKPTRRLTVSQYQCLLAAGTTEAMSHCQ